MTSRLQRDPDLQYFANKLQRTPAGKRLIRRWNDMERAENLIRKALAQNEPAVLDLARRSYIRLSDQCSESIKELENVHGWPPR